MLCVLLAILATAGTGLSLALVKNASPVAIAAQGLITAAAWALLGAGWYRKKNGNAHELLFRFSMVFSVVACLPLIGTVATLLVAWIKTI